jgi:hypothetical protein
VGQASLQMANLDNSLCVWIWRSSLLHSLIKSNNRGIYSFKYSQQDATLYNILYYCRCSTSAFLKLFSSGDHFY